MVVQPLRQRRTAPAGCLGPTKQNPPSTPTPAHIHTRRPTASPTRVARPVPRSRGAPGRHPVKRRHPPAGPAACPGSRARPGCCPARWSSPGTPTFPARPRSLSACSRSIPGPPQPAWLPASGTPAGTCVLGGGARPEENCVFILVPGVHAIHDIPPPRPSPIAPIYVNRVQP